MGLTSEVDWITPVGQSFRRKWALRGGSAWRLARLVQNELGIPLEDGLRPLALRSQGTALGMDRYLNSLSFHWEGATLRRKRVLLVDDFLTSGRTLRMASERLYAEGAATVSVLVSGIRISPMERATDS